MRGRREAARTQNASDDPFLLPISPPGDGARDHTGRAAKGKGGPSVFDRLAHTAATGRHIPSAAEIPLPAKPISGTNRFELRGILRAGTLLGTARRRDGCMIGKRGLGILGALSAIAV